MAAPRRDNDRVVIRPAPVDPLAADGARARRRRAERPWLHRVDLERQLHDGASLRISAMALRLGLLREASDGDGAELRERIGELQDELHAVLQELRAVAGKIYPSLLDEAGLPPALRELADERDVELRVSCPANRFGPAVEGAIYFSVAECLPPAPAGAVAVEVRLERADLAVRIGPVERRHTEFVSDQVRPLGGSVDVVDAAPGACTIVMRIPCG
jgi:signal transduction histidine kinase